MSFNLIVLNMPYEKLNLKLIKKKKTSFNTSKLTKKVR